MLGQCNVLQGVLLAKWYVSETPYDKKTRNRRMGPLCVVILSNPLDVGCQKCFMACRFHDSMDLWGLLFLTFHTCRPSEPCEARLPKSKGIGSANIMFSI